MNFFEAQTSARRSTSLLIFLFAIAVAGLVILSNFIVFEFLYFNTFAQLSFSPVELERVFDVNLSIVLSTVVIIFIALGSLYKLAVLSSGGSAIAMSLGGVIVPRSSSDPLHKKILNVVEEMAIASGTPVPQVYVLNEQGINAFAAGWKTTNAVIGITQGALERLSRDELQGVIAHEFSHIFNGDMRLNIRLIAVLHGILMIGLFGRMILRSMRYVGRSRRRADGRVVMLILGVASSLMIVGYTGTFFGNWIKSLISRQREYLADASAVQFTRNAEGIANALKKIGGAIPGSGLLAASVDEYSHAYFARGDNASGAAQFFSFSTHPPLKKRILRIQPSWDGNYLFDERKHQRSAVDEADEKKTAKKAKKEKLAEAIATSVAMGIPLSEALNSIESIGEVTQSQVDAAVLWHQEIPAELLAHAENPYGAQALILAILLHRNGSIRTRQLDLLTDILGELHTSNVSQVELLVAAQVSLQILPLIDVALPTLREMTIDQHQRFKQCIDLLINADNKVDLREWIIQRVVVQHLDEHFGLRKVPLAKYFVLGSAKQASEQMLSMLATIEHTDEAEAEQAFELAKKSISAGALTFISQKKTTIEELDNALDELILLKPPIKKRFLQACITVISHDNQVNIQSYELTRAIASCLDCPMPPVLVNVG